jgi:hypothetical protein
VFLWIVGIDLDNGRLDATARHAAAVQMTINIK